MEVDVAEGTITLKASGKRFATEPFPPELRQIIEAGGLMNFAKDAAEE